MPSLAAIAAGPPRRLIMVVAFMCGMIASLTKQQKKFIFKNLFASAAYVM
jgi:hypothetical protein